MAKFEGPGIKEWDFMRVWISKKLRWFVWKKLLESKTLLSSNTFHRYLVFFPNYFKIGGYLLPDFELICEIVYKWAMGERYPTSDTCRNKACTRTAQVIGPNPVQAWVNISQPLFSQLPKLDPFLWGNFNQMRPVDQVKFPVPYTLYRTMTKSRTVRLIWLSQAVKLIF